jgi:CheY-like chemotaxis protein
VKQLVELMNGSISVESVRSQGTRFNVDLELDVEESAASPLLSFVDPLKVFVLSAHNSNLIPASYLAAMDQDYSKINKSTLERCKSEDKSHSLLLIEIDDLQTHKTIQDDITKAKDWGVNIGLVTNTQPNTLPYLLEQKWQMPIISHPFTPEHFKRFINQTLNLYTEINEHRKLVDNQHKNVSLEGHVLIVEDNYINQVVASQMLSNMNLTFELAEDGLQAVTKIVNSPHYDLILMDIQMPNMDGYEATELLRKRGFKDLIICGLSANAMDSDYKKAIDAGMNDYLAKPIKQHHLVAMLEKYLPEKPTST